MPSWISILRSARTWWWAGWDARVAALGEGLLWAEGDEADELAGELIELADRQPRRLEPIEALAAGWHRLSPEARSAALGVGQGRWPAAIHRLVKRGDVPSHQGAARLIGTAGLVQCAGLLVDMLGKGPEASGTALQALSGLVEQCSRHGGGPPALPREAREEVLAALARGVHSVDEHQEEGVLALAAQAAARALPWPGAVGTRPLRAWLNDGGHPGHLLMRAHLRRGGDGDVRLAAWVWLVREGLGSACADRLLAPSSAPRHAAVWEAHHLWANPRRVRALRRQAARAGGSAGLRRAGRGADRAPGGSAKDLKAKHAPEMPGPPGAAAPVAVRVGYARWAAHAPMSPRDRDLMLGAMLSDPDEQVRLSAGVWAREVPGGSGFVRDLTLDAHPRVAQSAALALLCTHRGDALAGPERLALARLLARSMHEEVRRLAAGVLAQGAPAERTTDAALASASAPRVQPGAAEPALVQQIMEIRRAGGLADALEDLVAFVRSPEAAARPRALATALAALGQHPEVTPGSVPANLIARHASGEGVMDGQRCEPRVRANALEALTRGARRVLARNPSGAQGEAFVHDARSLLRTIALDANAPARARVAAVRGLLALSPRGEGGGSGGGGWGVMPEARRTLAALLDAPEPAQRASALWLIDRVPEHLAGAPEIVERVQALAADGGACPGGERAPRAAQRLLAHVRAGWRSRAASMEKVIVFTGRHAPAAAIPASEVAA